MRAEIKSILQICRPEAGGPGRPARHATLHAGGASGTATSHDPFPQASATYCVSMLLDAGMVFCRTPVPTPASTTSTPSAR